jgi:hypothetical protein
MQDQKLRVAMDLLFVALGWESDNVFLLDFGLGDLLSLRNSLSDPILGSGQAAIAHGKLHDMLPRISFGQG